MIKHKIGEIVDGNRLQRGLYYKYYSGDIDYSAEEVVNAIETRILYVINYHTSIGILPECYITNVTDLKLDWMQNCTYVFLSKTKFTRVRKPKIINNPNILNP